MTSAQEREGHLLTRPSSVSDLLNMQSTAFCRPTSVHPEGWVHFVLESQGYDFIIGEPPLSEFQPGLFREFLPRSAYATPDSHILAGARGEVNCDLEF